MRRSIWMAKVLVVAAMMFAAHGIVLDAQVQTFTTTVAGTRVVCRFIDDSVPFPRQTLLTFAGSADDSMSSAYTILSDILAAQHWFTISIDLPAHGQDARPGEDPNPLVAWRQRTESQEDWIGTWMTRLSNVVTGLIDGGYSQPANILGVGHSRGAFMLDRVAAVDTRIKAVALVQPLTDLLRLTEWAGVLPTVAGPLNLMAVAPALASRPTYLTIGSEDQRVGTDAALAFAWYISGWGGPWTWQVVPEAAPGHGPAPQIVLDQVALWLLQQ